MTGWRDVTDIVIVLSKHFLLYNIFYLICSDKLDKILFVCLYNFSKNNENSNRHSSIKAKLASVLFYIPLKLVLEVIRYDAV